ncbi:glycosyltransferase [Patescibacteria group bacterium]|nr:glycosyltransferase [Patescibacteria group bacterium]
MKLTYLANIRLPTEKAHGVQIMKMCEAFVDAGVKVKLIVPNRKSVLREDPFSYYGIRKGFSIIRIFSLDLIRFGGIGFFIQSISFAVTSALYMLQSRPSILFSRDPLQVVVAKMIGVPVVLWEAHTANWNWISRGAAKKASRIISISQGLEGFFTSKGISAEKILVEHDGVDLADFANLPTKTDLRRELELPTERFIIEYVGKLKTMGHPKGVEEIIHMAGLLRKKHSEIFLLLVGLNDDEKGPAEEIAHTAGLEPDDYRFVLHVSRTMVPKYLHLADILAMNYPNTLHYAHIMSPLKLFEYMASGTPILSSDLPSLREVLSDDTALLVPPDDSELLLRGAERLMSEGAFAKNLAENAYEKVHKYTWRSRAQRIINAAQAL